MKTLYLYSKNKQNEFFKEFYILMNRFESRHKNHKKIDEEVLNAMQRVYLFDFYLDQNDLIYVAYFISHHLLASEAEDGRLISKF